MKHKTCKRCGTDMPLAKFQTNSRRPDGHADTCSACVRTAKAESSAARFAPYGVAPEYRRWMTCGHVV